MSVTTPDHDWDFRITSENETIYQFGSNGTCEAGVFDYISNKAAVYKSSGSTQSSNTTDGVVNSSTNWIDIGALTYGTNISVEMYLKGTGTTTSDATIFNITKYESSVYDELYVNFADTTGNVGYVQQVAGTSSSGTLSNTVIPRNNSGYNHFVVTIDGTTLKTYLDGVLKDTATITSFSGERSNFYLGANRSTITNTGNEMNIKYCRLWKNNTLSSSNVTYLNTNKDTNYLFRTTPPPLPKNSWDFRVSTPSSNIVYDEVSNAAATYINNTISDTTDGATFTFLDDNNSSANTTGDYIQLDKYDWKTNNWSIEMYAYITDHQQYDALFSFATNTSNTYKMEVGFNNLTTTSDAANPLRLLYYNEVFGGSSVVNTFTAKETTVVRNAWNHYVYTYNSDSQVLSVMINGNIRFYVTGLVPDTSSATDILVSDLTTNPTFVIGSGGRSGIGMKTKYFRIWNGTMISEGQALKLYELRETSHIYSNVSSLLTLGYSHSEIINTFGKTLADYQAANISTADTPFASFSTVNKYKQTYFKNMLDISGEFVHRKHTFIGDISFNNDLSINNVMIVNNDLSFNKGLIVNGDASFNGNVNVTGDVTLNGTLKLKDNSIETSKLDFTIIENEGTFDTSQDVSLNSTFTIQGDFDKYLDNSGNIQTDFSENIVLIPSSLGLDLSGGSATLSGKTGDQAFLNGTYIVKDNSGNTTGNIYDDLHENTAENILTSLHKNWNSLQVNSRGNWVYDGSSNYTSYLDEYGRPQTVKGDNYDLTLPFHFYPSKAFLRTIPILPASSSINPHNYPASVKFLGSSVETTIDDVAASVGTPTYNYDFKHNQSIVDNISNNGGTLQGDASIGADGLTLDGTGDRFEIDPSNFTWGGTNTMEIYVKLTTQTQSSQNLGIMGFGGDDVNTGGAYFILQTGTEQTHYAFYQRDDADATHGDVTTTSINYDSFDHHVFVFDPTSGIKYYINGTLVDDSGAAYTSTAQTRSGYEYRIGSRPYDDTNYSIAGVFSHVRIWNDVALSSDQVTTLYNNRNNNISFKNSISKYHLLGEFSNKATTVIADSSANYPYNSVVYLTGLPTAVYAWDFRVATSTSITDTIQNVTATYVNTTSTVEDGLAYTGVASHATIPSGILVGGGAQDISLEIYFKYTAALGGWGHIFDMQLSDSDWTRLTQMGTQGHFTWVYGSMSGFTTNREITNLSASALVDTWIHLIATIEYPSDYTTSGTTARFYHNGSLINTTTGGPYSTSTTPSTTTDHIGRNPDSSVQDSTGNIRYMRWYNKQLSEDEVTSLYNKRDKTLLLDGISLNYLHGADFLYDLNRKYYINQLRMIVDQAPDSSGNSYGEYNIDKLAYSGSSFSGKKLENSYPNLYLNTAAHDISYGFTEDHITDVYDLSHNKNQLPIIDMSGGGGIHIAPREISIQDGSLNTINIHKPTIKNTYSKPAYAIPVKTEVTQPSYEWDFLVTGAANSTLNDNISAAGATYGSDVTSNTTDGVLTNGDSGPGVDDVTFPNNIEFSSSFSIEFIFRVNENAAWVALWKFGSGTTNNIFCDTYSTNQKLRIWMLSNSSSTTFNSSSTGTHTGATMNFDGSTFHHVVCSVNSSTGEAAYYQDGVKAWYQTGISLSESNFPIISSAYSGIGDVNTGGNVNFKKFRIWNNRALTETEIRFLYNNQSTNYSINDWFSTQLTIESEDFYSYLGARDASGNFNKRISQDGKTIATLQNRGYQAYDVSNAEVVFSTDYGKNWKNILRDCSDSFLFTEHDISYGTLFATGDASGAIDIATSSNGQSMYVGRHRNWVSDEISYSGLGAKAAVYSTIPISSSGFPQSILETTIPFVNNSGLSATLSGSSTHSSFDGDYTFSTSSNMFIARPAGTTSGSGYYAPYYWCKDFVNSGYSNHGDLLVTQGTGAGEWAEVNNDPQYNYGVYVHFRVPNDNAVTWYDTAGNATTENMGVMTLSFPSSLRIKLTSISVQNYINLFGVRVLGTEEDGTIRNLGTLNVNANNTTYNTVNLTCNNPITNIMFGVTKLYEGVNYCRIHHFFFQGTYQSSPAVAGVPITTNGLPEIYSTNYGNSWKLSPFKYHKGPTIISGDGSTILLLQESKLDNTKHAYATISGHGNNNPYVDTHWITTDYGSNWNTLNRSGYDISNNVIPPSYGSKTATFMKSCMSYTGQYIYIYNVQCTTNSNYGELYYSHDYGNTWNKWTTVEAQNYIASGNALAGSGQILCSGNGKNVFIAGQAAGTSRLSEAIYYRSSDYGVTFNKDITTFPWQEGSSGEDSTSRGPFVSYEGDLIVISNTHYNYLDDSSANQIYSSTTDTGLKYSLDYGVNYNVLDLSGEALYNATTNFSTLPNKTNKNLSALFSTKGDIFSNCPGPNDYSFLTAVMGGNTTDASFVFLQSIEFPKDKISTTVEKEGPVITTYEEPIDTENDFGNITNTTTLTSGVSFYSSAISEDGQVLLTAGATDVSNGNYYGGYNLTNAKFPPTENVVEHITPSFNVLQPTNDWDFRVASASSITDSIGNVTMTCYNQTTTTSGFYTSAYNKYMKSADFTAPNGDFSYEYDFDMDANTGGNTRTISVLQFNPSVSTAGWYEKTVNITITSSVPYIRSRSIMNNNSSAYTANYSSNLAQTLGGRIHFVITHKKISETTYEEKMYFNGTLVDTNNNSTSISYPVPTSATTPTCYLQLGNRIDLDSGRYYPLYHKFYRIWSGTILSEDDVTSLYNNRDTASATLASSWITNPLPVPAHLKTAQLSYDGNYAMAIPYGITQTNAQYLFYWSASGDFHRFDTNHLSYFDAENWKFGKLSGNGNFFVGFTHSSTTLSDASYNSATWWQDKVSNTMIIYKNLYTIPRGTVSDSDATTYGQGTTYDLNTAFSTDSGVTEYYITSVHVSETGQYVLFVGGSSDTTLTNRCAFSNDYGVTFTNISSLFSFTDITKPLVYCHVSDNGRYLFISQYNSSEYCFSTDYGASFSLHNTFPSSTKTYGVVSKDGQNALFVDTNNYVYVSVNGNFRQEVIPSLSGTNTNLSLNHNYWKYKLTTGEITYNPSMPNIKYLVGTANNIIETSGSITAPTHSYEFRLARSSSVSDQMGTGGTATYEGGSVSTTTDGVVLDNTDNTSGPKYVNITPPTISDSTHSIEIYFKLTTDIASYAMITSLKSASEGEKWISTTGTAVSGGNTFQNNNAQTGIDSPVNDTDPTAGTLYHAVVSATKNGNVVFYINNAATGSNSTKTVTTFSYTPTAWELGRRANVSTNYADITVYYVRWWDGHALSSSEVSYLYTNRADSTFISQIVLSSSNVRYTESYFSELDIKGSLTNLSGTAYTSSDYRVKENVRDLEGSDTIASLAPISYTQNNLHHKKSIGFLAHEFAETFPDLVDGTKDGPEMQSINYNGIIAVLIKEIQTLRTKINKLKSEI